MTQIQLITAPVIKHDLYAVGASVTERLKALNIEGQIATEDTVGALKKLRAELNKELSEFETQRKAIKEAVTNPYSELEAVYKSEVSDKYKAAGDMLKDLIASVEVKMKADKRENVLSYFAELCMAEDIEFLTFDRIGLEINLSTSEKQYKEKCFEFVSKVVDDLNLIDTQEHRVEIVTEYKKTLNASKSIKDVLDRKEAEKLERERIQLNETQRRQSMFWKLSMTFRDMTKSYNYINDDTIFILNSDIETLSKDDFNKRYVEIEQRVNNLRLQETAKVITTNDPAPVYAEPLKAPTVETKEPIVPAKFECFGTMAQLTALGQYMKQNNITYKNI